MILVITSACIQLELMLYISCSLESWQYMQVNMLRISYIHTVKVCNMDLHRDNNSYLMRMWKLFHHTILDFFSHLLLLLPLMERCFFPFYNQ